MAVIISGGGLMTVGTTAQQMGISRRGGGSVSRPTSTYLQTTREGIRDTRTGQIIASVGTSVSEADRLARESYTRYQAQQRAEETRRQLELTRKKAEEQKLQEQTALQKQQRIQARTIGGQVTGEVISKEKFIPTLSVLKKPVSKIVIPVREVETEGLFKKAKRFGISLFTPSIAPSEVKKLPKEERGLESAKFIFLGGLEGLYQFAKKGKREVSLTIPRHTGILTPIVGKKEPIRLGKVKPSRVVAELIPRTTAGVLAIRYFPKLPKAIQIPTTAVVTGLGVKGALDVSRTKEERIASGLIATGAGIGTIFQVAPYARGLKAQTIGRLTGKYKPIRVQPEGFKAIQLKETKIGLIPEKAPARLGITKKVKLPKLSPLKQGAFEVKPSE